MFWLPSLRHQRGHWAKRLWTEVSDRLSGHRRQNSVEITSFDRHTIWYLRIYHLIYRTLALAHSFRLKRPIQTSSFLFINEYSTSLTYMWYVRDSVIHLHIPHTFHPLLAHHHLRYVNIILRIWFDFFRFVFVRFVLPFWHILHVRFVAILIGFISYFIWALYVFRSAWKIMIVPHAVFDPGHQIWYVLFST